MHNKFDQDTWNNFEVIAPTRPNHWQMKLNEWVFRPPLCKYRPNCARRTACGWRDQCDDTALQTQDSKFEPWRSEAEHATSQSRRFHTILNLYEWAGKKHFVSLKLVGHSGVRARDFRFSKQAALTTAPGPTPLNYWRKIQKMLRKFGNFEFFSAKLELVRELVISNMHNKFGKDLGYMRNFSSYLAHK